MKAAVPYALGALAIAAPTVIDHVRGRAGITGGGPVHSHPTSSGIEADGVLTVEEKTYCDEQVKRRDALLAKLRDMNPLEAATFCQTHPSDDGCRALDEVEACESEAFRETEAKRLGEDNKIWDVGTRIFFWPFQLGIKGIKAVTDNLDDVGIDVVGSLGIGDALSDAATKLIIAVAVVGGGYLVYTRVLK